MTGALHSIVIPVFNEEEALPELHRRLTSALATPLAEQGDRYEIILVDDGSSDASRALMQRLCREDSEHVRMVALSRNFGHQAATTAGLDHARGETVTIMDADLQDPPELVLELISRWREGFDVVYAVREARLAESAFKRRTASMFYRVLRASTDIDIPADTGDFRLISARAARTLGAMRERHRFIRGMTRWIGFRQTSVMYTRAARFAGQTKFPLRKMARFAIDALSGFSMAPLRIATALGLGSCALGLLLALATISLRFATAQPVAAWLIPTLCVLILGGAQLISIGVLGEYVGRILEESKRRPLYVLDELVGLEGASALAPESSSAPTAR